MHSLISEKKSDFESVLNHVRGELAQLRTGRATPALVEDVLVEAYGSLMDIKSIASITIPDPKTLTIEPWDKSLLKPIEKAIQKADIGVNPAADGQFVRLNMPQMTEENRLQMVKLMKERLEEGRVSIRNVREKTREQVMKMEKNKEIPEDEKFKMLEELDKLTKEYTGKVDEMGSEKEKEIMTI